MSFPHLVDGDCPVCAKGKAHDEAEAAVVEVDPSRPGYWVTHGGDIEATRETGSEPILADQPPERELGT